MAVTPRPHEVADLQAGLLGEHVREQRIGRDVEGDPQEHIRAALVELQRETTVGHVQLEEGVARLQRHLLQVADVPRRDHHAPRVGVGSKRLQHGGDLVDASAIPGVPRTPLHAVHRPEVAVLVRPLVPDADPVLLQPGHVRGAGQEPQELADDGLDVNVLRRDQREPPREVVAQLRAEDGTRARARAIPLRGSLAHDAREEILVLAVRACHVSQPVRWSRCVRPAGPGRRPSARSCSCA